MSRWDTTLEALDAGEKRPVTVTLAAGLMVAVAVTYLVVCALSLSVLKVIGAMGGVDERVDVGTRDAISAYQGSLVLTVAVDVVVTVVVLLLAVGNLRRRGGARVGTWVVAGLFLLCALCGSVGNGGVAAGWVSQDSTNILLRSEIYPSWYTPAMVALDVVLVVCYAGVIVLLALPVSKRYFEFVKPPPVVSRG